MEVQRKPHPPRYTEEGTIEHAILDGAERYFAGRDERLRFGLVKRVFQWMLDTDANGWFERVPRRLTFTMHSNRREPSIRPATQEIDGYLGVISNDIVDGSLTDELSAMRSYLETVQDQIPEEYEDRYEFVSRCVTEYEEIVFRRMEIRRDIGGRVRIGRPFRHKEVHLPPHE